MTKMILMNCGAGYINGEVNTAAAGTYTCTFCVVDTDGNASNNAELTVVVE